MRLGDDYYHSISSRTEIFTPTDSLKYDSLLPKFENEEGSLSSEDGVSEKFPGAATEI